MTRLTHSGGVSGAVSASVIKIVTDADHGTGRESHGHVGAVYCPVCGRKMPPDLWWPARVECITCIQDRYGDTA